MQKSRTSRKRSVRGPKKARVLPDARERVDFLCSRCGEPIGDPLTAFADGELFYHFECLKEKILEGQGPLEQGQELRYMGSGHWSLVRNDGQSEEAEQQFYYEQMASQVRAPWHESQAVDVKL